MIGQNTTCCAIVSCKATCSEWCAAIVPFLRGIQFPTIWPGCSKHFGNQAAPCIGVSSRQGHIKVISSAQGTMTNCRITNAWKKGDAHLYRGPMAEETSMNGGVCGKKDTDVICFCDIPSCIHLIFRVSTNVRWSLAVSFLKHCQPLGS